mgnify:CR=1 FL=1
MVRRKKRRKSRGKAPNDFDFDIPSLEIPEIKIPIFETTKEKKVDPNRLSRIELISALVDSISSEELYRALIRLGRGKLAEEFKAELERINEKYEKIKAEIGGEKEFGLKSEFSRLIIDELVSKLKEVYKISYRAYNEIDFHKQLEPFLVGLSSAIESALSTFGLDVKVIREFELPSRERIDLMVLVGKFRVGIEVKYSLDETSKVQRLLGQIDEYAPYCDCMLIVIYNQTPSNILRKIKEKEKSIGKEIRIVTPVKVW